MKKISAVLLSAVLFLSAIGASLPMTASAGESNEFSCSFETNAEIKPYSGYYCGASNANGYKVSGDGYKYDNYSNLLTNAGSQIKNGHHMAIPVVQSGIGHNSSKGAMRLMYDGNVSGNQANPGFSVMDSADNKSHKPKANTSYSITLYYKAEKIMAPVVLYAAQKSGALSDQGISDTIDGYGHIANITALATVSKATSGYVKATATYTGTGGSNLIIYMVSSQKANQAGTSVLIDDISVKKITQASIQFNSNGGTPVTTISGITGESVNYSEVPLKENAVFDGWFTDASLSTPAPKVFPASNLTLFAKWKSADTTLDVNENFEGYDAGKNVDGLYSNAAAGEISTDRSYDKSGSKSLKMVCEGYKNVSETPQWVLTNRDGNPAYFETGKTYSVSAYIWVEKTRDYNIRLSTVSALDAAAGCRRHLEYEQKKNLVAGIWNKVSCAVTISGMEGFNFNYLTYGVSLTGGEETDTYVFYTDGVKAQQIAGNTLYYSQDYEGFEAQTYTGNEPVSIRGNASGRTVSDEQNHTGDGSKALKMNMNQESETNMARTAVQFDNEDFAVNKILGYEVSFWVYTKNTLSVDFVLGITESTSNFWINTSWSEAKKTVEIQKDTWTQITIRKADFSTSGYLTLAAACPNALSNPQVIYIDDVSVTQYTGLGKLIFHTNEGEAVASHAVFPNDQLGLLPDCVRDGFVFEGWYDKSLTIPYSSGSLSPDSGDMDLYARWSALDGVARSLSTGFEKEEYSATPYANMDGGDAYDQLNMSAGAMWMSNAQEYANHGTGVMKLVNDPFVYETSEKYQAAALMNPDGTRFKVIKGQRYRIKYSFLNDIPDSAHSYVTAVVSSSSVYAGVGASDQCLTKNVIHGIGNDWSVSDEYFTAYEDGFVYLTLCARKTTTSGSSRYHTVYIDDVTVDVLDSSFTAITFMSGEQLVDTKIGKIGTVMQAPALSPKAGYEFTGWYTEKERIHKYDAYTFSAKDIILYAGYKAADAAAYTANAAENVSVSFEETEFLRDFYNTSTHRSYDGDNALVNELELVNDSTKAHSGNYSIKMNPIEWHYFPIRFSVYDPANPYGILVLQPGEEYKISYYVWLDIDIKESANMMLYLTDVDNINSAGSPVDTVVVDYSEYDSPDNQWTLVEHTVTNDTGKPKAIAIGNQAINDLNCCYVDDISVVRLRDVSITIDTMGGDHIDPVTARTGYYLEEPYTPYREGYLFEGWYTDPDCKNPYNFAKTVVTGPFTLYAGWKKEESEEQTASQEDTSKTTESVKKINNGTPPSLLDSDSVSKAAADKKAEVKKSVSAAVPLWKIIVPASAGVLVIAGGIAAFLLIRSKKKRNRGNEGDRK